MKGHPKTILNTNNAENLIYRYTTDKSGQALLEINVLGGIRLDSLDRMRVTLKITVMVEDPDTSVVGETAIPPVRHNLDLYNSTQVEKLIRLVADKLEVGTSVIAGALIELTNLLEEYRLEEREQREKVADKHKFLTSEEIKQARLYLTAPNLMARTREDIGRAGVIGEEDNRLLMYLIFTSRKRDNPLHVISLGSSGIGKTHLQEKVSALIPEEDKMEITSLSGNAFYYFGQQELRNKLILIEDLDGTEEVLYPLREIKSKRRITKTVVIKNSKGETRTVSLLVEGPVCVAGCTTKESLYEDNANRSFLVYIDESKQQDSKIMAYQRKLSAGKIDLSQEHEIQEQFKDMQRLLVPVTIRNPYAESLEIPEEVFKPRRSNAHYLAFIEVVTFYHQHQREKQVDKETGEIYIETNLEDIEQANKLMKNILLRKSDQLNGATRDYFEKLKIWLDKEGKETFTNREIRIQLRIKGTTLRRYHHDLLDVGLIRVKSGKKSAGFHYEVISPDEYEQLKQGIATVLDEVLENSKASEPSVSHSQNGVPKRKGNSKLATVSQQNQKG